MQCLLLFRSFLFLFFLFFTFSDLKNDACKVSKKSFFFEWMRNVKHVKGRAILQCGVFCVISQPESLFATRNFNSLGLHLFIFIYER